MRRPQKLGGSISFGEGDARGRCIINRGRKGQSGNRSRCTLSPDLYLSRELCINDALIPRRWPAFRRGSLLAVRKASREVVSLAGGPARSTLSPSFFNSVTPKLVYRGIMHELFSPADSQSNQFGLKAAAAGGGVGAEGGPPGREYLAETIGRALH